MWKYWANNRNFLSPTINYLLPSQLQMDPKSQRAPFGMAVLHQHGHTHTHKLFLSFSMLKYMLSLLARSICKIAGSVARDCDLAVKQKKNFPGLLVISQKFMLLTYMVTKLCLSWKVFCIHLCLRSSRFNV